MYSEHQLESKGSSIMDKKNAVMKSEFNNENDLESFDLEALQNTINDNIEEE